MAFVIPGVRFSPSRRGSSALGTAGASGASGASGAAGTAVCRAAASATAASATALTAATPPTLSLSISSFNPVTTLLPAASCSFSVLFSDLRLLTSLSNRFCSCSSVLFCALRLPVSSTSFLTSASDSLGSLHPLTTSTNPASANTTSPYAIRFISQSPFPRASRQRPSADPPSRGIIPFPGAGENDEIRITE